MYERFTDRARKVMQLANQEAQRFNHEYIGTEHILLGLVKDGSGVAANVLKNLGVGLRDIRLQIEKIVRPGPEQLVMGKLPQTPRAKKVIEYAIEEARNLNHNWIGTEHILLGLLREEAGVAAQVLTNLGVDVAKTLGEIKVLCVPAEPAAGGASQRWHVTVQQVAPEPSPEVKEIAAFMAEAWQRFTAPWKAEVEARFPHLEFDWNSVPVRWGYKVAVPPGFGKSPPKADGESAAWKPGREFL